MISRVYISHSEGDEDLAMVISMALNRIGLENFAAMYHLSPGIFRAERVSFGIRNSDCLVALITKESSTSTTLNQEVGLAKGLDLLIIPLLETGAKMPFLIGQSQPIEFTESSFKDAVGLLIKTLRDLSRLEWLRIACPCCGEEMTQYLTIQEEVDESLMKGSCLETVCSYCQNMISLDPRTFAPMPKI
jgi:hypothetical protein